MRHLPLLTLALTLAACGSAPPPTVSTTPSEGLEAAPGAAQADVDALAEARWAEVMRVAPTWASYLGDRSRDAEMPDLSTAAREKNDAVLRGLLDRAQAVDVEALDDRRRIILAALIDDLSGHFRGQVCKQWSWTVSQLHGPQSWLGELPAFHQIDGEARARTLVLRYRAIPQLFADQIANLRVGMAEGRLPARINVERVIEQLERIVATPLEEDPMRGVPLQQAERLDQPPYAEFEVELTAAVTEAVRPAYARYLKFLKDEMLPKARPGFGVSEIPDGAACYRAAIGEYSGMDLDAEAIHQLGLDEVARIEGEMRAIAQQMGDSGEDLPAFLVALSQRPDQSVDDPQALIAYNEKLLARAQAKMPEAFGRLPKTPVELKAIEAHRAPEAPAAYYYAAPKDGSRPAYYYLNVHQPKTRILYKMPALAYHEAVPGHHLQIALANEAEALPAFMQRMGNTAFTEGWALYAEALGFELGLYETPAEKMGALTYEMWRAARLVIDTGLHAKGWTRQQAIDYLRAKTGNDAGEVVNEIDRYIVWPGQALAYKTGQLAISRMRAEAEAALGDRFDLRAFHDALLQWGGLPISVLDAEMKRWLARQTAAGAQ